eukprot:GDKK01047209.1.p1 GENE.GDKK01047209.1~~GDKK01047209.1.p1  ORF type:complete len:102 (+),score=1.58 GDKK01047209.1:171-476(+)
MPKLMNNNEQPLTPYFIFLRNAMFVILDRNSERKDNYHSIHRPKNYSFFLFIIFFRRRNLRVFSLLFLSGSKGLFPFKISPRQQKMLDTTAFLRMFIFSVL